MAETPKEVQTPEELAEEAVEHARGALCRDPERIRHLTRVLAELLGGDPKHRFLTIAFVGSYECDREGHEESVHAMTGLVTRVLKLDHADVRLVVARLRDLANDTERQFPAPPGERPYVKREDVEA